MAKSKKNIKKKNNFLLYLNDHIYLTNYNKNIIIWYKDCFYTSQCHKEERFSTIKGILVCLSKIAGYTYTDIKEKLALRGCQDSDKAELFYLYDIVFENWGLTELDIKNLSQSVISLG